MRTGGCSVSGLVARVELEGTGPALPDLRSAPAARESLKRARVCGHRVLLVGLEDLEPRWRLGKREPRTADESLRARSLVDEFEARRRVEETGVQHLGCPLLTGRAVGTVGEDDVHTGDRSVAA